MPTDYFVAILFILTPSGYATSSPKMVITMLDRIQPFKM